MTGLMTFLCCGLGSFLLAFPVGRLLGKFGVVDRPNSRSSHTQPTVRGGGVAILLSILLAGVTLALVRGDTLMAWLLPSAMTLAVVSFWDDMKSVSAGIRFGCHAGAALMLLAGLNWPRLTIGINQSDNFVVPLGLSLPLLMLWLAGYTNAFNFMDGINGIATCQAIVTGVGTVLLAGIAFDCWDSSPVLFSLAVAGAAMGFLPHNFPCARMFMGDVGSAPLGYILAALVCWVGLADHGRLLVPLMLLHANFVMDTGVTLFRRMGRGDRWYAPHREHFYQRLVASGKSHAFVTGWQGFLQLIVLALMLWYLRVGTVGRIVLGSLVILLWSIFLVLCEQAFRAAENSRRLTFAKGCVCRVGE